MRNPITGLGPAAYRRYAAMEPLAYGRALWLVPVVNSHNNYVDLFSQVGLLGLGLFLWFVAELTGLGFRLRSRFSEIDGYMRTVESGLGLTQSDMEKLATVIQEHLNEED